MALTLFTALDRPLRVTIAHDFLTQAGGAERVVLSLLNAFPDASLVTSVYDADGTFPQFRDREIRTSPLQRVAAFRRDPRRALALLPQTWSNTLIEDADVVIASSTGFAHGVTTSAPKIVYCHNPARWLHQRDDYLQDQRSPVKLAMRALDPYLRTWDRRAAASATRYLANSTSVSRRIQGAYGINAEVVHPPIAIDIGEKQEQMTGIEPGFVLTIARLRGYKNTEVACRAVEALPGERLVVVGGLPDDWRLSDRITGVGRVGDAQLRWLYANCRALVAPSYEDFGLTPLEAAAFGKPTVGLRAGGYLDTIEHGVTGLLVDTPCPEGFASGLARLSRSPLDSGRIERHAERFSARQFIAHIQRHVHEIAGTALAA